MLPPNLDKIKDEAIKNKIHNACFLSAILRHSIECTPRHHAFTVVGGDLEEHVKHYEKVDQLSADAGRAGYFFGCAIEKLGVSFIEESINAGVHDAYFVRYLEKLGGEFSDFSIRQYIFALDGGGCICDYAGKILSGTLTQAYFLSNNNYEDDGHG